MKKFGGVLTNWFQYKIETGESAIFGTVVDDPNHRFRRGDSMLTSRVISLDRARGIAETEFSVYELMEENTSDTNIRHKFSQSYGNTRFFLDMRCIVRHQPQFH